MKLVVRHETFTTQGKYAGGSRSISVEKPSETNISVTAESARVDKTARVIAAVRRNQ